MGQNIEKSGGYRKKNKTIKKQIRKTIKKTKKNIFNN